MSAPSLGAIKRSNGVAGQISYTVDVTYPGEKSSQTTFVGNRLGGPIVMVMPSGAQVFVSDAGQYGPFGQQWVRNFFAPRN